MVDTTPVVFQLICSCLEQDTRVCIFLEILSQQQSISNSICLSLATACVIAVLLYAVFIDFAEKHNINIVEFQFSTILTGCDVLFLVAPVLKVRIFF